MAKNSQIIPSVGSLSSGIKGSFPISNLLRFTLKHNQRVGLGSFQIKPKPGWDLRGMYSAETACFCRGQQWYHIGTWEIRQRKRVGLRDTLQTQP